MPPLRVGLLGCGAINSEVAAALHSGNAGPAELVAVLVRSDRTAEEKAGLTGFTTDPAAFFAADWQLCVEAAGQPAVIEHAKTCLELGRHAAPTMRPRRPAACAAVRCAANSPRLTRPARVPAGTS